MSESRSPLVRLDLTQPSPLKVTRDPANLARHFLAAMHKKGHTLTLAYHRGFLFHYAGTHWVPISVDDVRAAIFLFVDAQKLVTQEGRRIPTTRAVVEDVLQAVRSFTKVNDHHDVPVWLGKFDKTPPEYLACQNVLIDLATLDRDEPRTRDHTASWFSPACLSYAFDPTAQCPQWVAFLDQVLEKDPERIAILQEWFGLLLVYDMRFQKFLVLLGEGGNGKSVVLNVLTALLDPANVSTVDLACFGDRFALYQADGKLANISSEPGRMTVAAENKLKEVTGGDRITVERKYADAFQAQATIRVVIAANTLPAFSDRSQGIARRMQILPFRITVPPADQDRHLTEKLKQELPGILNWSLAGLRRLNRNGTFSTSAVCEAATSELKLDLNSAAAFLTEYCTLDDSMQTPKLYLFKSYQDWAKARGYAHDGLLNDRLFGKEVKRVFPSVDNNKSGPRADRTNVYDGLAFTPPMDLDLTA